MDDHDEEGGDWVARICNDPNYQVIGEGDSLAADWPAWLHGIADARQALFDEAEALGLDGADYASPPDLDDPVEVEGFLEGLGVAVSTDLIERTGGSSHDGFAYVRRKSIPKLQAREGRRIAGARRRLLKDAVKSLTPDPEAGYAQSYAVLKRLYAALDDDFLGRFARLEEAEAAQRASAEQVRRLRETIEDLKAEKEALEGSLGGEGRRTEARLAEESRRLAKYEELGIALRLRFGVTLTGPMLTFADGTGYLIQEIFGQSLEAQEGFKELLALGSVRTGQVHPLTFADSFRKGGGHVGPLDPGEIQRRFQGRWSWGRAWWVVLGVTFGSHEGGFIPSAPLDFRIPAGREEEWRALLKMGW